MPVLDIGPIFFCTLSLPSLRPRRSESAYYVKCGGQVTTNMTRRADEPTCRYMRIKLRSQCYVLAHECIVTGMTLRHRWRKLNDRDGRAKGSYRDGLTVGKPCRSRRTTPASAQQRAGTEPALQSTTWQADMLVQGGRGLLHCVRRIAGLAANGAGTLAGRRSCLKLKCLPAVAQLVREQDIADGIWQ